MSAQGLNVAAKFGESLPSFLTAAEAEKALLAKRDQALKRLFVIAPAKLNLDFSLESLKRLEIWYFEDGKMLPSSEYSLPHGIGFYFGEVLCRHGDFKWIVDEFIFKKGTYEIGVSRELTTIMLTKGLVPEERDNKRRQSLFRRAKFWIAN